MLLDNIYGLLNLFEFKINHFNSLVQAKSEFKNSNFGGKYIEIMSSLMFSNKYDFRWWKNQAIFEEKYSMQYILLLASQESRKTSHRVDRGHNRGEIFFSGVSRS